MAQTGAEQQPIPQWRLQFPLSDEHRKLCLQPKCAKFSGNPEDYPDFHSRFLRFWTSLQHTIPESAKREVFLNLLPSTFQKMFECQICQPPFRGSPSGNEIWTYDKIQENLAQQMGSRENRILKVAKWRACRMKPSNTTHAQYMCWSMEWKTLANECRISLEDGYDQFLLSLTPSLTTLVIKQIAKKERKKRPPMGLADVAEFVESDLKNQDDTLTLQRISRAADPVAPAAPIAETEAEVAPVKTTTRNKSRHRKKNESDSEPDSEAEKPAKDQKADSEGCQRCGKTNHKLDMCWFKTPKRAPLGFQIWLANQSKNVPAGETLGTIQKDNQKKQ
jgi:hypothetical protein